jgi:predicted enzyme related to lactoylglutathione lyase
MLAGTAPAPPAGHVTGIGGVFVRSPDPVRLSRWYNEVLGIRLEPWGGALLRYDAPGHPPVAVWNAFPPASSQFTPSTREFMINLAVDDLDAILKRLQDRGVPVVDREEDENGRFASIVDPDGTKIEIWQSKR